MTDLMQPTEASQTDEDAPVQLVTPDGRRVADDRNAPYRARTSHLGPEELRGLYRDMVLVRRFDTEATALQRQGELALFAPLLGQEAAQIGSGRALAPQDVAFPSYREHGVAHTRGLDMAQILRLFRGVDHGGWDSEAHNFHLYTLVIGSHSLHATGYAWVSSATGSSAPATPSATPPSSRTSATAPPRRAT